jgi:hypothetical protein
LSKLFIPLIFSFIIFSQKIFAAPCCGAGFAVPSIITSEDKAQFAASINEARIHADVFPNGDWQERKSNDISRTIKLEGAHIFADRFQFGVSVPYISRKRDGRAGGSDQGLGDLSGQLGFELMPDWDYHPYRPKGILYLSLIAPTGRSLYESTNGLDTRGRGFWGIGSGLVLTKAWGSWDANGLIEWHYFFPKNVQNENYDGKVNPGYGGSIVIGGGYNWEKIRIGTQINWQYEAPTNVKGPISSNGSLKRLATGTLLMSYLLPENRSIIMSYADQTILGSPTNSSLSKSITLFFQKRWAR